MEKIKKISIPDKSRVIVIGDIHGELDLLKELVQKVHVVVHRRSMRKGTRQQRRGGLHHGTFS